MKMNQIVVSLLLIFSSFTIYAQDVGFTYQAVAMDQSKSERFGRDSQGEVLASQDIRVRFSITEESETGAEVYSEEHQATTDVFGMFRLVVGRGEVVSGTRINVLEWGLKPYFLHIEINIGNSFEYLGFEELMGSPYSLNSVTQTLSIEERIITLSGGGGSITIPPVDPAEVGVLYPFLDTDVRDDFDGNYESLSDKPENISEFNNDVGYITAETDGSTTNEIQTLSLLGNDLSLSNGGGTISLPATVDGSVTNEIQDLQLTGNTLQITNNVSPTSIDLSPYLDNTDTQLTEAQVVDYVNNNGYLLTEVDGSITNEIQTLSLLGNDLSLSNGGGTATIDGSITNEIQDLQLSGNNLSITNNTSATTIDLNAFRNAFVTTSGVTSNTPGTLVTDNFVFGSPQLDDDGNSSHDNRMFFDKSKGAFRAGNVLLAQWDDVNRGIGSAAFGRATTASGEYSSAFGSFSVASGEYSSAFGDGAVASGDNSSSFGHNTAAIGDYSSAFGNNAAAIGNYSSAFGFLTQADGEASSTFGRETRAESYVESVFGSYNTNYTPNSTTTFNTSDRLFVLGNGIDFSNRSDALIILKSGSTTLHGALTIDADNVGGNSGYTFPGQDGTALQVMTTDGFGTVSWATPSSTSSPFSTTANVTSNASGTIATDDFVFGSPQLDDDGNASHDARVFFDKNLGAFRAGKVASTQWNTANRGFYSIALGEDGIASGHASFTSGQLNTSSGSRAFTAGLNNTASGNGTFASGEGNVASGSVSFVTGLVNTAPSFAEAVFGSYNTNYTPSSTTTFNTTDRLFVIGNGASSSARSDALVVLKNGNTTLNGDLEVNANDEIDLKTNNTSRLTIDDDGSIRIDEGVIFDCDNCGSTTTIDGTDDYGDMIVQGRVVSTSDDLHLSPPDGSKVIISTTYRSAGGATGTSGLEIRDGGIRMNKNYRYYQKFDFTTSSGGIDDTNISNLGSWDFCALSRVGFENSESGVLNDPEDEMQCTVYPSGVGTNQYLDYDFAFSRAYNAKPTWLLLRGASERTNGLTCSAICINFE